MDILSVLDLSGSGGVDMLTRPVATARAAVATGVLGLIETRHVSDTCTWKNGSLIIIFTNPPEDYVKNKKVIQAGERVADRKNKSKTPQRIHYEYALAYQKARTKKRKKKKYITKFETAGKRKEPVAIASF